MARKLLASPQPNQTDRSTNRNEHVATVGAVLRVTEDNLDFVGFHQIVRDDMTILPEDDITSTNDSNSHSAASAATWLPSAPAALALRMAAYLRESEGR